MNTVRIEQLKQFLKEDPADPFHAYALGLEYVQAEPATAEFWFDKVIHEYPDYLPVYYPAAQLKVVLAKYSEAIELFENGLQLAQRLGESKTLRELNAALEQLRFELE